MYYDAGIQTHDSLFTVAYPISFSETYNCQATLGNVGYSSVIYVNTLEKTYVQLRKEVGDGQFTSANRVRVVVIGN